MGSDKERPKPGDVLKSKATGEQWSVVKLREVTTNQEFKGRVIVVLRSLVREGVYEAHDLDELEAPAWVPG